MVNEPIRRAGEAMRAALLLGLMGAAALLAGCAGRDANPEPVDWAFDKYYTCQDIAAEKDRISQEMVNRYDEQASRRSSDNDLMARTIPFLPVGDFAIDENHGSGKAKSAQQVEIDALKARDAHLNAMSTDRGC
jgi:hypothetical protein